MRNNVKRMNSEGRLSAFLQEKFQRISVEKFKAGISDGPQISELMKDPNFDESQSETELSARQSLKSGFINILRNQRRSEDEKEIEENGRISANLRHECQSNCIFCVHTWTIFHRTVEIRVKNCVSAFPKTFALWKSATKAGGWLTLADYCWCLKMNAVTNENWRKSMQIPFIHE